MKCPKSEEFSRKRYQNMHEPRRRRVAAPYANGPYSCNDPEALIHTELRPPLTMLPFVAALAPTSAATMYLPSNRCNTSVVSSTFNHSCCARAATQQSGHCILYGKVKTPPK